jgi:hypothetical protein
MTRRTTLAGLVSTALLAVMSFTSATSAAAEPTPSAPPSSSATPSAPPTAAQTPTATPTPRAGLNALEPRKLNEGQNWCPQGTHEGCHTYEDMQNYLGHLIYLIWPDFNSIYPAEAWPAYIFYVANGISGPMGCTTAAGTQAPYDSASYAYCPPDRSVYIGQDTLFQYYQELGDAAPAIGLAHEIGHHIQTYYGVPAPTTTGESWWHENQADCFAGWWFRSAEARGIVEYPDDIGDLNGLLAAIASAEGDIYRDHGDIHERSDAFNYGYNYGLRGCAQYYPNTPIAI